MHKFKLLRPGAKKFWIDNENFDIIVFVWGTRCTRFWLGRSSWSFWVCSFWRSPDALVCACSCCSKFCLIGCRGGGDLCLLQGFATVSGLAKFVWDSLRICRLIRFVLAFLRCWRWFGWVIFWIDLWGWILWIFWGSFHTVLCWLPAWRKFLVWFYSVYPGEWDCHAETWFFYREGTIWRRVLVFPGDWSKFFCWDRWIVLLTDNVRECWWFIVYESGVR